MSQEGRQVTYCELLQEHQFIQIPMIQRDYAQGRESEREVRDEFLKAIAGALNLSPDDGSLPLNLDFVYGSVVGDAGASKFLPLDGQQRLTTLFLLHWFLAWNDEEWADFSGRFQTEDQSKFTYRVRPSSSDFFDFLASFRPTMNPAEVPLVSAILQDQPGYFRSWRLDPTIQSTLVMLDAIRNRFVGTVGLFARLTDTQQPTITFQLLNLEKFHLSDDLYIKMNARGVPLTAFETFKARYEQELANQFEGETRQIEGHEKPIHEFVSQRLDTRWLDMFWATTKGHANRSAEVDTAIFNIFRGVALISRDPEDDSCTSAVAILTRRCPTYSTFHELGWLDESFTEILIPLLERWSLGGDGFQPILPNSNYFDEKRLFARLTNDSSKLEVSEILQFMGYAFFINFHENDLDVEAFQTWMRVIHNLVVNSTNIDRAERIPGGMIGIRELISESAGILTHLESIEMSESVGMFARIQLEEESLKAKLLNHHERWQPLIDRAELHDYFRGQIGFLLAFSGTTKAAEQDEISDWADARHEELQAAFAEYLAKAEAMFDGNGVVSANGAFLWERGLLCISDYTFPMTAFRRSFLFGAYTETNSWKRLLRGFTPTERVRRPYLKQLWDKLDNEKPFEEQLLELITSADLEPWRMALVRSHHSMAYCKKRLIRRESDSRVYLLATTQMNGAHAELFSYEAYCQSLIPLETAGGLAPLNLGYYYSKGSDKEPGIQLFWQYKEKQLQFDIEWTGEAYKLYVHPDWLADLDDLSQSLVDSAGFEMSDGTMRKVIAVDALLREIHTLCSALNSFIA